MFFVGRASWRKEVTRKGSQEVACPTFRSEDGAIASSQEVAEGVTRDAACLVGKGVVPAPSFLILVGKRNAWAPCEAADGAFLCREAGHDCKPSSLLLPLARPLVADLSSSLMGKVVSYHVLA